MANLITQRFTDNETPAGWVLDDTQGSITFTGGVMTLNSDSSSLAVSAITPAFAATPTLDMYFKFTVPTYPASSNMALATLLDAGDSTICQITVSNSVPRLRLVHGGITISGASDLVNGATYHCYLTYTKGTGSDGVAQLYYSTSEERGETPNLTTTIGTATADAVKVGFYHQNRVGGALVIDSVVVESVIGEAAPPTLLAVPPVLEAVSAISMDATFTVQVEFYATGATVYADAVALTTVETSPTILTVLFPDEGFAIGSSVDITVVDSNGTSNIIAATVGVPIGMVAAVATVAYADLPVASVLYLREAFDILTVGHVIAIQDKITIGGTNYPIAITGQAVVTYSNLPAGTYENIALNLYDADTGYTLTEGFFDLLVDAQGTVVVTPPVVALPSQDYLRSVGVTFIEDGNTGNFIASGSRANSYRGTTLSFIATGDFGGGTLQLRYLCRDNIWRNLPDGAFTADAHRVFGIPEGSKMNAELSGSDEPDLYVELIELKE